MAHGHSVSPEGFAECAKRQLPYVEPNGGTFFAIGRGDKQFPLDSLTSIHEAKVLIIAIGYDAVTVKLLPVLWAIEVARRSRIGDGYRETWVVGDIGKDAFTGKVRYGLIQFSSTMGLLHEIEIQVKEEQPDHLGELQEHYLWKSAPGGVQRLCNAYIKGALKRSLTHWPDVKTVTL